MTIAILCRAQSINLSDLDEQDKQVVDDAQSSNDDVDDPEDAVTDVGKIIRRQLRVI